MSFDPTSAALDYEDDTDSIFDSGMDPLQGLPSSGAFVDPQAGFNVGTQGGDDEEEEDDDGEEEDENGRQDGRASEEDLPSFCKR